jgi:hypothetical protein
MESKETLIKKKLLEFYKNKENLNILLPIILQKTRLSLRSLDWFVTNYCKKNNINYLLLKDNNLVTYFPYKSYKSQLKAYSKKFCDPFCRRERVIFDYKNNVISDYLNNINIDLDHNDYIITTLGQLNFFKFAIKDSIIKYAIENINDIEKDMNTTLKSRDSERKFMEVEKIKRKELSVPGNKSIHITRVSAVIKFL